MIEPLAVRQFLPALRKSARKLLEQNTKIAEKDGVSHVYTTPSAGHYPFQWFWDSCFYTMVWATLGETQRAKDEIRALLAWQEPNGFIPHVIFWDQTRFRRSIFHWHYWESKGFWTFLPWVQKPKTSAFIQPPVLAQAIASIFRADGDVAFLQEVLPKVRRYYGYLASERDPDGDALISTIASFETGCDYSPVYWEGRFARWCPLFAIVKPRLHEIVNKFFGFRLRWIFRFTNHHAEDVLVNSLYAQGLQELTWLACVSRQALIANWAQYEARQVHKALLNKCYDEKTGLFWTLIGKNEKQKRVKTVASLLPLVLHDLPKDIAQRLITHIADPREFATPLPVPTVARDEPTYAPDNRIRTQSIVVPAYWSGAVAGCTNYLIIQGLRSHNAEGIAEEIWVRWARASYYHGLPEFQHPEQGWPPGIPTDVPQLGWGALVIVC